MNISKYDLEGNFLKDYKDITITELSKILNINRNSLNDCIKKRTLSCGNFQFIKTRDKHLRKIGDISNIKKGMKKVFIKKMYNNKLICIYESIIEASKKTGINKINISNSLKTGQKANLFNFYYL